MTWQGWACWERHLACALFLLASRSWELVPLNFYKSRICELPRRRGACGSCGIFFNKTWIRFVIFYFPSSSPLHPPFHPSHLFCLPSLEIWNPPNPDADVEKHTAFRGRAEMWGGMASTPLSPLSCGHRDLSVVSAPAHAQRMGNETLCEVCFDPHPHPAQYTHHFKSHPLSLNVRDTTSKPRAHLLVPSFSPGSLLLAVVSRLAVFRVGLCVMCGFLFEVFFFSPKAVKVLGLEGGEWMSWWECQFSFDKRVAFLKKKKKK